MLKKTTIVFGPSFPILIPTKKKWNPLNFPKKKKNYEKKNIEIERKKTFSIFGCNHVYSSHTTYCVLLLYYYWLLWFIFNINDGDTLFLIITLKSVKSKWKNETKNREHVINNNYYNIPSSKTKYQKRMKSSMMITR